MPAKKWIIPIGDQPKRGDIGGKDTHIILEIGEDHRIKFRTDGPGGPLFVLGPAASAYVGIALQEASAIAGPGFAAAAAELRRIADANPEPVDNPVERRRRK